VILIKVLVASLLELRIRNIKKRVATRQRQGKDFTISVDALFDVDQWRGSTGDVICYDIYRKLLLDCADLG
jgi:hypothetical protein